MSEQAAKAPEPIPRNPRSECWSCQHRRPIPWDAHIRCANPSYPQEADYHGVVNGWFHYPHNFDPTWKRSLCPNYEEERHDR